MILYEAGSTHFIGNNSNWFSYVYTCTRRIKIINKKAFGLATIKLPLYVDGDDAEVLSDVKAVTYNLDNGIVSSAEIDKSSIFSEVEGENNILKKFTLPALKEGCIIEYKYTITSPYEFRMPSWKFQSRTYPVLWSEYQVSIPTTLTYAFIKQGVDSFFINKAWEGKETYSINKEATDQDNFLKSNLLPVIATTVNHRWVEKDAKPLNPESYISSSDNYIDKIEFQLSSTYNGQDKSTVLNTWESLSAYFAEKKILYRLFRVIIHG